jgi:hypothetical protein
MAKGGVRPNSGRKKGSQNKTTKEFRELLLSNRVDLLQKAINISLGADGETFNPNILMKLLDKITPTLEQSDVVINHKLEIKQKLAQLSVTDLRKLAKTNVN